MSLRLIGHFLYSSFMVAPSLPSATSQMASVTGFSVREMWFSAAS